MKSQSAQAAKLNAARMDSSIEITANPSETPPASPSATPETTLDASAVPKPAPKASRSPKASASAAPKSSTSSAPKSVSRGSTLASKIIATAKSCLGVPYVWGGTSPKGFDCSGFVQYVFSRHGISLSRTASDQYNAGISVSKSSLKAGDLVFFETYKSGASHVGIYLGGSQFIHASSGAEKVMVSNLTSSYYTSHYIGARRVIN
ncbi:MAG TPA: glycoside hydrolase [Ruminiclostridium sp.]|nr:glycoside hydrolase [Ruminiclostridium sp.]